MGVGGSSGMANNEGQLELVASDVGQAEGRKGQRTIRAMFSPQFRYLFIS